MMPAAKMEVAAPAATKPVALAKTLNLKDLTLLVVGSVIGSGIFLVPGAVQRQVGGSVQLTLLVWIVGGVLSLLGALTYGELAAMKPAAGGLYVYIRDGFGELPAFLYGWTLFLVISTGSIATLAVAFSAYLGQLLPLSPFELKVTSIAMIGLVTAVNIRGTRQGSDLQNWTTFIKLGLILIMSAVLLWFGRGFRGPGANLWSAPAHGALLSGFGLAMVAVLWAYEGWQYIAYSAGEAVHPQHDFPLAFLYGTSSLIAVYVIAALSYIVALGPAAAAQSDTIAATAMHAVFGSTAAKFVALMILISTFGSTNSIQLTAPRVFFAMAQDGLFFRKLAEVHPKFRTPAFAILTAGIWAAFLACLGSFQQLFTYVVFTGWIFYGLAGASIFMYRRRAPEAVRPYRVPGYPVTPAIFVLAASAIVLNTIVSGPQGAAEGLGILALGLPVYFIWRFRSPARAASRG